VNDTWLADSARVLYKSVKAADRLTAIKVDGTDSALDLRRQRRRRTLQGQLRRHRHRRFGPQHRRRAISHQENRAALNSLDAARAAGWGRATSSSSPPTAIPTSAAPLSPASLSRFPSQQLSALAAQIDAGKVKVVVSVGEASPPPASPARSSRKVSVIYLGTHANATSAAAKVVLPTLSVFEKNGTFMNQPFRIQKFAKAIPARGRDRRSYRPRQARDRRRCHRRLRHGIGLETHRRRSPCARDDDLAPISPRPASSSSATPFAALPFVEGETLHYKPAQPAVAAATA